MKVDMVVDDVEEAAGAGNAEEAQPAAAETAAPPSAARYVEMERQECNLTGYISAMWRCPDLEQERMERCYYSPEYVASGGLTVKEGLANRDAHPHYVQKSLGHDKKPRFYVTGFDLAKLYTGSLGALGVIDSAWLRLRPRPGAVRMLCGEWADREALFALSIGASRRVTARAVAVVRGTPGAARVSRRWAWLSRRRTSAAHGPPRAAGFVKI